MPTIYNPLVPTGTLNLDVDYKNIQNNFQQLDTTFGVDHVTYSVATDQNGYHESIHFNPVSTTATNPTTNNPPVVPAAVVGYGQLFSVEMTDINTDTALYFLTGGNRLIQLTRNFQPTVTAGNGYTFLAGGFIMQWGVVAATNGNPTIVFPLQFPSDVFSVQVTRQHAASSPGSSFSYWVENTVNTTQFKIINNDGHTWSYNWVAIGN